MKHRGLFAGIVVVVIAAIAGIVIASSNNSSDENMGNMNMDKSTTQKSKTAEKKASTETSDSTAAQTDKVTIKDFAFVESKITVKVGTKVTWTNEDSIGHTVTADNASSDAPDSPTLNKGESYSFTFNKAGTYAYHCTPHTYMKGTVTVTE